MKLARFLFSRRFEVIVTPLSSDCSCSRKRKVQLSMRAGMRTVVPF